MSETMIQCKFTNEIFRIQLILPPGSIQSWTVSCLVRNVIMTLAHYETKQVSKSLEQCFSSICNLYSLCNSTFLAQNPKTIKKKTKLVKKYKIVIFTHFSTISYKLQEFMKRRNCFKPRERSYTFGTFTFAVYNFFNNIF